MRTIQLSTPVNRNGILFDKCSLISTKDDNARKKVICNLLPENSIFGFWMIVWQDQDYVNNFEWTQDQLEQRIIQILTGN